jgi:hypothetical protein
MSNPDWAALRAAWLEKFAGREESPEASWELAEIEECQGDGLFFGGESGAAPHYRAARTALLPPGQMWSSREESDRRMEAHGRITNKLYAIDPYGKARPSHDGVPHPNFQPAPPEPVPEPSPEPPKPSIAERRAAALELRRANAMRDTEWAALFRDAGHWVFYELAMKWRGAGEALAPSYPEGAQRAFAWSIYYFERYNREWTAHLPASRWDPDGTLEMVEVQEFNDALAPGVAAPLPGWVESLLAGDWRSAHSELGDDSPGFEFQALGALLTEARRAAGLLPEAPQ